MPPHFHIEGRGCRAVVEIGTLQVRAGEARFGTEALDWARENVATLLAAWHSLNRRA